MNLAWVAVLTKLTHHKPLDTPEFSLGPRTVKRPGP